MLRANAQEAEQATLLREGASEQILIVREADVILVPADRIVRALGGTIEKTTEGFALEVDGRRASVSTTSRTALFGENLITMPVLPVSIENRLFVPIEFFADFLRPSELALAWDETLRAVSIQPLVRNPVSVEVSIIRVEPISKLILQTEMKQSYQVVRRPASYVIRFGGPVYADFSEKRFDDPMVSRVTVRGNELEVFLRTPQAAADAYELESPPRIVLDIARGSAPTFTAPPPPRRPSYDQTAEIDMIVIDPGHGGVEIGAQAPDGFFEKDLTLAISKRLREILRARGWRVTLTRDEDTQVAHDDRTAIANQQRADLFLSIHMNAAPVRSATGAETYFLSLKATDERARLSAERENLGAPAQSAPGSNDLDLILWDLAQQSYLKESSRFAEHIQDAMAIATGVERRGVKQAPFRVLVGAMMPAVLVEVGFISNPDEANRLRDDSYQTAVASALADGIEAYRAEYESRENPRQAGRQISPDAASAGPGGTNRR